jgi:hypothetical protein
MDIEGLKVIGFDPVEKTADLAGGKERLARSIQAAGVNCVIFRSTGAKGIAAAKGSPADMEFFWIDADRTKD